MYWGGLIAGLLPVVNLIDVTFFVQASFLSFFHLNHNNFQNKSGQSSVLLVGNLPPSGSSNQAHIHNSHRYERLAKYHQHNHRLGQIHFN